MNFPKEMIALKKNFIVSQAEGMDSLKEKLHEICFSLNEQKQRIISLQTLRYGEGWRIYIFAEGLWSIPCVGRSLAVCEPPDSPCRNCTAAPSCAQLCVNYFAWQRKTLEDTFENLFGLVE